MNVNRIIAVDKKRTLVNSLKTFEHTHLFSFVSMNVYFYAMKPDIMTITLCLYNRVISLENVS